LLELIANLNPQAIIFYMKTKGKKRGYTEAEVNQNNFVPYNPNTLTFEERMELVNATVEAFKNRENN